MFSLAMALESNIIKINSIDYNSNGKIINVDFESCLLNNKNF